MKQKTYRINRGAQGTPEYSVFNRVVSRVLFSVLKTRMLFVAITPVIIALILLPVLYTRSTQQVSAAPNNTINFQARLLTNTGALVPDGNYHIEFKIYDQSSGGTLHWTETRSTGNLVAVKNGYISVALGSVNPLSNASPAIDWGDDNYLTMNIGGSGGSASWNGEMSPRMLITSVPYALRASEATTLKAFNGSNATTLSATAPTANRSILLPDADGTVCLQTSSACGYALLGSANTFTGVNTFSSAGTALQVTNNATIGGTLGVTGVTTATGGLTVGTGSNFINQGSTLFSAITISDVAGGGNIGTAAATVDAATTFNVNQTTSGQTLTLPNPTNTTAGRMAFVNNTGSTSFTMYGSVIATGKSNAFIWNGTAWVTTVSLSGSVVNTIGTIDSIAKVADGASISTNAIYLQTADATYPGLVSTGAQTIAGAKTFSSLITGQAGLTVSGATTSINDNSNFNTTINTGTSTGTVTIGSSNAGTISIQSSGAVNTTAGAASTISTSAGALTLTSAAAATWSTAAGNLTLQAGSGTVSLGTSTALTATGALGITSGGANALSLDAGGAAALNLGLTNANAVSISRTGITTTVNGNLTVAENTNLNGNTTIGNATTDRLTVTSQILGQDALVFQGATDNGFSTTLAVTDPTANNVITLPNESGTICTTGSICAGYAPSATNGYVQLAPASAQADATNNASIYINKTSGTGNIIQLQKSAVDVFSVSNTGQAFFRNTTNSTTSFRVQRASSDNILSADTSNNRVKIGNDGAASGADTTLFVVDSATTTNQPTGVNGGMFYDTTLNKFRCYENGAYKDCDTGVTTVGAFSGTSIANGASISGGTITFGPADATNPGMVTTGAQTIAGAKTFSSLITGQAGLTVSGATTSINDNSNFNTTINTGTSTGTVTIGSSNAGTISIQSSGAVNTTAGAASTISTSAGALTLTSAAAATWSTAAGNLTLQAGSGTVSLGTSTALTATGALGITSGGANALSLDAGGAAALNLGLTNANAVSISRTGITTTVNGNLTVAENTNLNGNTTIGNATTDRLTVTSQILGQDALVFQGATDNGFATTFRITDPTANNTITFPNTSGTVQLAPASGSYIMQTPTSTADNTISTTANAVALTVNGTTNATASTALAVSQPGAAAGITVASANNTATNGLSFSGTFTNLISSTNFSVTNAGAVTAVGVNSGTGLIQGTGGLTVTGTTNINATGAGTTTIGNASAGAIAIQSGGAVNITAGAASTFSTGANSLTVTSSNFNVSSAGVITAAGAQTRDLTTASAATANALTLGPGASTAATGTGAALNLRGGDQSGTTTSTGGAISILGGNATGASGTRNGGAVTIDAGTGATANGAVNIGGTNAASIGIGRSGITTTITGGLTQTTGAVSLTGNAASSLTTSAGALTLTSAAAATWSTAAGNLTLQAGSGTVSLGTSTALTATGALGITSGGANALSLDAGGAAALNLGLTNANAVSISRTGITTTVNGNLTVAENTNLNGNTTIGNATTDRLTVTSQILGQDALVFQGATDNGFATTFRITDPTANNTITFPDASGTVLLAPAGSGNGLVQVPTSNTAGTAGANVIQPTAASISGLTINATSNGTTGATALIVNQGNVNGGTFDAANINVTNTTGTIGNGLIISKSGAGTVTSLLNLTQSAGTATNGIIFNGTIGTDITTANARNLNIITGTTGQLALDTGSTGAINIGTNANAKTVTIGNTTGTSIVNLQGGTGTAAGDINIGDTTVAGKIIDIGSVTNAATSTIRIATAAAVQTVSVGSTNSTSTTTINGGVNGTTPTISLQAATNGYIALGTTNANTIQIGAVGTTANATTVNIANTTGAAVQTVNIGSTSSTSTTTIQAGANGANTTLALQAASGGVITMGSQTAANTINVGTVGSAAFSSTVNVGTSTGAAQTVSIGSTNTTSTTNIYGGTGNINLLTNSASASVIVKSQTNGANAFQIQNTSNQNILNVSTTTTRSVEIGTQTNPASLVLANSSASATGILFNATFTDGDTYAKNLYGGSSAQITNDSNGLRFRVQGSNASIGDLLTSADNTALSMSQNSFGVIHVSLEGASDADNFLGNGSFEFGCDGWNLGACNLDTSANARSGSTAWTFTQTGASQGRDELSTQFMVVAPGEEIQIEAWLKRSVGATGTAGYFVYYYDKSNAWINSSTNYSNSGSTSYTKISDRLTVPANAYYAQVGVTVRNTNTGAGQWWFDDVRLSKINKWAPQTIRTSTDTANAFQVQNAAGNALVNVDTTSRIITVGSQLETSTVNIGTVGSAAFSSTVNIGNSTGAAQTVSIGSTNTTSTTTIQAGSGNIMLNASTLQFTAGANRTINVASAATPNTLTVAAGTATGANTNGAALYLQGGSATSGNASGGNVFVQGGTGIGSGAKGLVVLDTATYATATTQTSAVDVNITQSNIDSFGAIILNASAADVDFTLSSPTLGASAAGRVIYVTAANGSSDFTLRANVGGGVGVEQNIAMRQNTTATMIWNGSQWTAAGASSSTTLQAAYDNTLSSAGGAEIVLNNTATANGLTVRNNATSPIIGGIFETQTSIGSNLFSVNNNATEFATNGGAETLGASASTFPANTWDTTTGGTVDRYTTAGDNIATGAASVRVQTTTTNHGARNRLSTTLTSGLTYSVSFAIRGATNFSTLDVRYSPDGTTAGTTQCTTAEVVTSGIWTRINCTFVASGTITSSNSMLIRQTDGTARTFYIDNLSININASATYATDGSVDNAGAFGTNWTAFGTGSVAARDTGVIYDSSASARVDTTNAADRGIRNNMSITPAASTQYLVSFYARSGTGAINDLTVRYSEDGGTSFVSCVDYNTQAISTSTWTKITCLFTADSTLPGSPNPDLIFTQATAPGGTRSIYIDALSVTLNTNNANNVQIGGANKGGPTTLFTLDRSDTAPIAANNDAYLGSMYYDTTTGRIQCYEADGWGACGSAPDNIVNLNPEYAGAVLNGSGVGTMTADLCADQSGVLQVNAALCDGTGNPAVKATNFYKWTSPQASQQTYSIFVSYQLPTTFKSFSSDDTVQLTARVDSTTNAAVTYEMFRSEGGTLYRCGTGETAVTTSANQWQTVGINGNESTGCGFTSNSGGAYVIFKINVKANSNANAYVSTLSFVTTGK